MAKQVDRTVLSNGYVISTIERSKEGIRFDNALSELTSLVGDIGRADLSVEGIYETMVFPGDDDGISDFGELDYARYETEEEALEGHQEMAKKWREMPPGIARDIEELFGP